MKLKEHLVARKVVKDEINRMIEDFQSKDPTLRDKEWSSDGKNYSFKQDVVISTYRDNRIVDFNIGDIYLKLEPLNGEFYIVKSLHEPMEFMYRDERVITLYDKYMNGEIK